MPGSGSFPTELSPADRLMWRIEQDPILRSAVVVVGVLDREPEWTEVQETFRRAIDRVPRLRQVVTATGFRERRLQWREDDHFALDYHVRRIRAPHPAQLSSVLELAAPSATSSFDAARPPWECTLVEGLEAGRAAFILKFHHTITDGVGGVDLAGAVFDPDRQPDPPPPVTRTRPTIPASFLDQAIGAAQAGFGVVRHPADAAIGAWRLARSIGRMLEPVSEPLSPALRGRGIDRRLDVLELPLDGLRDAAHAIGGTINDVYLAGVAGGLHDYHQRLGFDVPALRVTMPISVRREGDPPGGNHFTPARFVLPIDDPDPAVRARIAGGLTRRWRDEAAVGLTSVLARFLDQVPARVVTPLFGSMLKNVDVDAVDVPGLTRDAFLGGARIDRLWAFAPPTGAALSVTLLSHLDTACIALMSDRAAVERPELLLTSLESAFHELLGVGGAQASELEEAQA